MREYRSTDEYVCFSPQPEIDPDRDWLSEHMDRADRATWVLRDGGNCGSCQSSPFEMAENCNSLGIAALAAIVRSCERYCPSWRIFRDAEFRVPGQVPPSENENEPIKYCQ